MVTTPRANSIFTILREKVVSDIISLKKLSKLYTIQNYCSLYWPIVSAVNDFSGFLKLV